jgi:hypothetical protein
MIQIIDAGGSGSGSQTSCPGCSEFRDVAMKSSSQEPMMYAPCLRGAGGRLVVLTKCTAKFFHVDAPWSMLKCSDFQTVAVRYLPNLMALNCKHIASEKTGFFHTAVVWRKLESQPGAIE